MERGQRANNPPKEKITAEINQWVLTQRENTHP